MSSLNEPAMPTKDYVEDCGPDGSQGPHLVEVTGGGFTKRERACIDLRIPETGDAELDALIEKARLQEIASDALQGLLSAGFPGVSLRDYASDAKTSASLLVSELERSRN